MARISYAESNHPLWVTTLEGLRELPQRHAEPWWVHDAAPELVKLRAVVLAAEHEESPYAAGKALLKVVKELIHDVWEEPKGIILRVVLPVEKVFVDFSGVSHDLHKMKLFDRRTLAGDIFRGGSAPVQESQMRQGPEKEAFRYLTALLVRSEMELTPANGDAPEMQPDLQTALKNAVESSRREARKAGRPAAGA